MVVDNNNKNISEEIGAYPKPRQFICEELSNETSELEYEEIYNGNIHEQIRVFRRFEQNFEVRNNLKNSSPCDHKCDLLISAENSFG